MPAPETLREYDAIVPGAAERILKMAESDTTQRAEVRQSLADAEVKNASEGRNQAFALALIAVIASVFFFAFGNQWGGVTLLSMPTVMMIRSFFPGGDK